MKNLIRLTSLVLVLMLSLALILACAPAQNDESDEPVSTGANIDIELPESTPSERENQILGKEGNIKFFFAVTHEDGTKTFYNIETTKDTLAGALLEGNLIKGEEGPYGLYVTEIRGEVADFDKDGSYWYFYKDGEPLMQGISETPIANDDSFEAVYTKQ
jgi:hypothetical protein